MMVPCRRSQCRRPSVNGLRSSLAQTMHWIIGPGNPRRLSGWEARREDKVPASRKSARVLGSKRPTRARLNCGNTAKTTRIVARVNGSVFRDERIAQEL